MTSSLARAYVRFMHSIADTPVFPSVDDAPPSRRNGNLLHWFGSLPAIHDLDRMVALDSAWWTYKASDAVAGFLQERPGARVFEWGSGASTIWLSKRAKSVFSVEHDEKWQAFLDAKIKGISNVTTRLVKPSSHLGYASIVSQKPGWTGFDFTDYAKAIYDVQGAFDLIVIDGRVRSACLEHAVEKLAPSGIIVVDNSHRKRYQNAIAKCGLTCSRMRGLTPSLPYPDETSLLRRPD